VSQRIFIISQHSVGMGHLSRASALAGALSERCGFRVTLFSGGRAIPEYVPPSQVRFVQLPATERTRIGEVGFSTSGSTLSLEQVEAQRSAMLAAHFKRLRPDAVIIEHFPFVPERYGRTLDALLDAIGSSRPKPLLISSIRTLPVGASRATAEDVNQTLRRKFDHVLHHADPRLFPIDRMGDYLDAALEGVLVTPTGFVRRNVHRGCSQALNGGLLLSVGGGRDGRPFLERWIAAARLANEPALFPLNVVCGPLMPPDDRARMLKQARDDVIVHASLPDMEQVIADSRAIVCMGGYNTLNEALSMAKPVLSFPRQGSPEQCFQVRTFAEHGLIMSGEHAQDEEEIARLMERLIRFRPAFIPDYDGAHRSAEIIKCLLLRSSAGSKDASGQIAMASDVWQ